MNDQHHILVTGAAGFIGSNLCEYLLCDDLIKNQNIEIIGMDWERTRKSFLSNCFKSKNFTMMWEDIHHIEDHAIKLRDTDIIYHLAASADIRNSLNHLDLDLQNNTVGTHAILEFMRKHDVKELVFASTSSLYGMAPVTPTPEDLPDLFPISQYGASKLACEAFIKAYASLYGMRARIYRFANVTGKNMHRGVIWDFIHKLQKDPNVLEILGDGNQTKSLFDVGDCIRGFVEISKTDGNAPINIYNLGNENTIIVRKIANIICEDLGVKPIYKFTGGDRGWNGDTPFTILSIEKAKKAGWTPTYSIFDCIHRTVADICEREKIKKIA
jgi:UDP-glucose 4-epimerase